MAGTVDFGFVLIDKAVYLLLWGFMPAYEAHAVISEVDPVAETRNRL